jgi:hypothetical protein
MIFMPCKDGISHNEIEDAKPEHITAGCNVLLHAMLERATGGNQLIVGEAFAVEAAARKVAKDFPQGLVPDGQQRQAAGAQLQRVSTTTSRSRPT